MFCVEEFYKLPFVKKICLVSDRVEYVQNLVEEYFKRQDKIVVVSGGQTRHMSIKNGLTEISKSGEFIANLYFISTLKSIDINICFHFITDAFCRVVVIHDGARPLVPEHLLTKVIQGAVAYGAAGPTRPLISTVVKAKSDGCLESSLDRKSYVMSETPQAFVFQLLFNAYQKVKIINIAIIYIIVNCFF